MEAIDPRVKAIQKQTGKVPGTIRAKNKDTGVEHYIREDMLKIEGHPWELLAPELVTEDTTQAPEPDKAPDVILTKEGNPFKTEGAARTAFKSKNLSEMEYVIIPVDDGFIITKV